MQTIHYSRYTIHCFAVSYHNADLSLCLSVDPLADKYPNMSPYAYCAGNPVKLVDPDGRGIYILFYTDNGRCFKASAETRKYNIEHSKSFNPQKDKVFLFGISDLADIESKVSQTVEQYSGQYAKTAEFGIWSHAGFDGPSRSMTTSGDYSSKNTYMVGSQMNMGWSAVMGGTYAYPLSCYKNGKRQFSTYQTAR